MELTSHPLSSAEPAQVEMAIAQALTELTGRRATVKLCDAQHSPPYLDAGHSTLHLSVTFAQPNPEEGSDFVMTN